MFYLMFLAYFYFEKHFTGAWPSSVPDAFEVDRAELFLQAQSYKAAHEGGLSILYTMKLSIG